MIIEKNQGSKMMKMTKVVIVDQKMIFCGSKKTMMPSEIQRDFSAVAKFITSRI